MTPEEKLVMAVYKHGCYRNELKAIYPNEKDKIVVVIFCDGEKEIIRCAKEDKFDLNVGVALAIAQHVCGSKTKFHKQVAKLTHVKKEKK